MRIKTFFLIAFTFLSSIYLKADCASNGLSAYPTSTYINTNPLLVLECYAYSSTYEVIHKLNSDYPIYLESKNEKIKLTVKSVYTGMMYLTQATLVPEKELTEGDQYFLKVDGIHENLLKKWDDSKKKFIPFSWVVKHEKTNVSLEFSSLPTFKESIITPFGCGPSVYVLFHFPLKTKDELLIKTKLIDLTTQDTILYLLNGQSMETLSVGHGMCSGAFTFKPNHKYKIQFSLMDFLGNESEKKTDWILFDSPWQDND